jgi:nucleoside-diphosphate-sugar epimerase
MAVFVTGGSGFVGKYVISELLAERYKVYALTHDKSCELKGVHIIKGDVTQPIYLPSDVASVFHCAGVIVDEERMPDVNVIGTKRIVEAALAQRCQLVHLSSAGVIGPTRQRYVDELTKCQPDSLYERTKLEAEKVVLEGVAAGLKANMLRPTTVFGIGRVPEKDSFLHLLRSIKSGKYRNIAGGRGLYGIVHAREIARAMLMLAQSERKKGEAFFINTPVSFCDFSATAADAIGCAHPGNISYSTAYLTTALFFIVGIVLKRKMPLTWSRLHALTSMTIYLQDRLLTGTNYRPAQTIDKYISLACKEYMQKRLL